VSSATVQLLSGPEPSLLADAVRAVVDELIGNDDRGLLLQDLSGEDYPVDALGDAAQTVPFLTDRRVVVARGLSRFAAPELGPLVQYLSDPAPTTDLVIEWGSGRVPKVLTDAIDGAGGSRVNTGAPGNAKGRRDWFAEQFDRAGVVLDARARTSIVDRLGEDVGRLGGILATLEGVFGAGARLGEGDIAPYLGGDGGVPPWDLTDAIDAGDLHTALTSLERMLGAGARHPLQIMATLHSHYERMLRLDGARVANDKDAAAVLGMKGSTFPAKKALNQGRRLGHDGVARALALLANADLDLRGRSGLEGRTVMEVLVARLSRL
jgi:DNA polymerase-3 subunit delta